MGFLEGFERFVALDVHQIPVVEAGSAHGMLVDLKPERADQMEWGLGRPAGARDRPGVRRDLRLDQDHVERAGQRVGSELGALGHSGSYDRG